MGREIVLIRYPGEKPLNRWSPYYRFLQSLPAFTYGFSLLLFSYYTPSLPKLLLLTGLKKIPALYIVFPKLSYISLVL
jgi:hypothetical protein